MSHLNTGVAAGETKRHVLVEQAHPISRCRRSAGSVKPLVRLVECE